MRGNRVLISSLLFVCISMLLVTQASAQTTLVLNATLESEFLNERTSQWYEPNNYTIHLDAGDWHVDTVGSFLEIKIIIANDSEYLNIIAESGTGYGHFPNVNFTLSSSIDIYIQTVENSVYGNTGGFYDIGVFDESHEIVDPLAYTYPTDLTDTTPNTVPDAFLVMMNYFLVPTIFAALAIILGFMFYRKSSNATLSSESTFITRPPPSVFSEQQSDGLDIRTVRVPAKCPNCNASLSNSEIDWIGPLEAKCMFCGATVRASLEKI